jgi:flap endonuclease-1
VEVVSSCSHAPFPTTHSPLVPLVAGIAATTAYKRVKEEGSLKAVVGAIDKDKLPPGVDYDEVKALFLHPEVIDPASIDLKWGEPNKEELIKFLVEEKGFSAQRVEGGIAKLVKARTGGSQMRMDSFFKAAPSSSSSSSSSSSAGAGAGKAGAGAGKRKADEKKGGAPAKKGKK